MAGIPGPVGRRLGASAADQRFAAGAARPTWLLVGHRPDHMIPPGPAQALQSRGGGRRQKAVVEVPGSKAIYVLAPDSGGRDLIKVAADLSPFFRLPPAGAGRSTKRGRKKRRDLAVRRLSVPARIDGEGRRVSNLARPFEPTAPRRLVGRRSSAGIFQLDARRRSSTLRRFLRQAPGPPQSPNRPTGGSSWPAPPPRGQRSTSGAASAKLVAGGRARRSGIRARRAAAGRRRRCATFGRVEPGSPSRKERAEKPVARQIWGGSRSGSPAAAEARPASSGT